MSIFKRLFGGGAAQPARVPGAVIPTASTGRFYMDIVGESNYQPALLRAQRSAPRRDDRGRPVVDVRVECEPSNPYDSNALRVCTLGGETIGYLSRERAAKFCGAVAQVGGVVSCQAVLVGDEIVGAWIDLCDPPRIPGATKSAEPRRGVEVVGEMKCQDALKRAREGGMPDDDGRIVIAVHVHREAVDVVRVASPSGDTFGYLSKPTAKRYSAAIERTGGFVACTGTLHGGEPGKPGIGIWLELAEPDEL